MVLWGVLSAGWCVLAAAGSWLGLKLIGVKWMRLQLRNFYERIVNSAGFWHSYFLLHPPSPYLPPLSVVKHLSIWRGFSAALAIFRN